MDLHLALKIIQNSKLFKNYSKIVRMRWWTIINVKNYNISSTAIIKTPKTCTIKCYSVATTNILFLSAISYYTRCFKFEIISRISWSSIWIIDNVNIYNFSCVIVLFYSQRIFIKFYYHCIFTKFYAMQEHSI